MIAAFDWSEGIGLACRIGLACAAAVARTALTTGNPECLRVHTKQEYMDYSPTRAGTSGRTLHTRPALHAIELLK